MNHGLNNDFLCAACKIEAFFVDDATGDIKTTLGTGFFVQNLKNEFCLITNRHMVDIDYKQVTNKYKYYKLKDLHVYVKQKDSKTNLPTKYAKYKVLNHNDFRYSDTFQNDVACLTAIKPALIEGDSLIIDYYLKYNLIANSGKINEKLSICDMVAFPGYPPWFDKMNNLPILRTGTIASDPRFNYSFTGNDDGECIAYEAFSYGGSSGSPVFAVQKGINVGKGLTDGGFREIMLVGINAGHLPLKGVKDSHSGISYFYKSSVILELLNK